MLGRNRHLASAASVLVALAACAGRGPATNPGARPPVVGHPDGGELQRQPLPFRPYGVAVGSGFALVTQLDGRSVTRFSLDPFQATATIAVGNIPTGIALDAGGTHALVTNQYDPSVGIIDIAAGQRVASLPSETTTFRAIFSSDGSCAYATLSDGTLMVIDPAMHGRVVDLPIVGAGNGIAFGRGDTLLYVTGMSGGISVVNTHTNTVVRTFAIPGALQDVVPSPDGTSLFVATESEPDILVISLATGTVSRTIQMPSPGFGLALTPDGTQLWVAHTSGMISVIDIVTGTPVQTITLGGSPRRIAFDRYGTLAIVSDESGSVVMIR